MRYVFSPTRIDRGPALRRTRCRLNLPAAFTRNDVLDCKHSCINKIKINEPYFSMSYDLEADYSVFVARGMAVRALFKEEVAIFRITGISIKAFNQVSYRASRYAADILVLQ